MDEAKSHGVHTGLCGDMASDERALPILAGLGLDEISLTAPGIPRTKAAISRLESTECRGLLGRLVGCESAAEVIAELEKARTAPRPPKAGGETPPPPNKARRLLRFVGLLVVLVAALGGWLWLGPSDPVRQARAAVVFIRTLSQ